MIYTHGEGKFQVCYAFCELNTDFAKYDEREAKAGRVFIVTHAIWSLFLFGEKLFSFLQGLDEENNTAHLSQELG